MIFFHREYVSPPLKLCSSLSQSFNQRAIWIIWVHCWLMRSMDKSINVYTDMIQVTADTSDTLDCVYKSFWHRNMSWQIHTVLHKFPVQANKYLWRPRVGPFSLSLVIVCDSFCFLCGKGRINLNILARRHEACRFQTLVALQDIKTSDVSSHVLWRGIQLNLCDSRFLKGKRY